MLIKIVLVICLLAMVFNLFKAMRIMLNNDPKQPSMTKYIGRRLIFSAAIMALILIAVAMGWITPNPRPY